MIKSLPSLSSPSSSSSSSSLLPLLLLLLVVVLLPSSVKSQQQDALPGAAGLGIEVPTSIHLRAGVLHAPPFAIVEEQAGNGGNFEYKYSGFEVELLQRLQVFAQQDNVTLTFDLKPSPSQYGAALDLVANDCNLTGLNENDWEDCSKFDLIVGDYYCNPQRSVRVDFTPSWLRTTMSTIKYIDKKTGPDYTTLTQASKAKATVCVPDGTYLMTVVMAKFPEANYMKCSSSDECIEWLQSEQCVLYADDELLLRYRQSVDPSLEVTREQFNTQYLVWPLRYDLPAVTTILFKKWMYSAVSNATLDDLYFTYFQKQLCPVGTAGQDCELPCDPDHGTADARGVCVCQSIKWTGDDCSIEVEEEVNMIPNSLKLIAFVMFGINVAVIVVCGMWLIWQKGSAQVRVSQPSFLLLVLLGCLISSSTILVMAQEDAGDGPVHACMAIPWLYSVGFSITFGTLFAKIRRVYLIFMKAAQAQSGIGGGGQQRKNRVTFRETLSVIGLVLVVDLIILIAWTIVDPLVWERTVITADQFGTPLESEGFCTSEYWTIFAALIAALHLVLLGVACYMCYVARDIPTKFSEGKYLAIAMISNLQIFVVGVPILIILGPDPQTSFFVRSVIIWMNDLAVVTLIFGNLMYSVHFEAGDSAENVKAAVDQAMHRYSTHHRNDTTTGDNKHISSSFQVHTARSQAISQATSQHTPVTNNLQKDDDHHHNHNDSNSNIRRNSKGRRKPGIQRRASSRSSGHTRTPLMTPSQVSWGEVNESLREQNQDDSESVVGRESSFAFADEDITESSDDDDDDDEEEAQEEIAPLRDTSAKSTTTKDVLRNNRTSWGGVNFSTMSNGTSEEEDISYDDHHHDGDHNDNIDNSHSNNSVTPADIEAAAAAAAAISTKPMPVGDEPPLKRHSGNVLPPANLPKPRTRSMTYAESRISRIRGQHAQIVAQRKSAKHHRPVGRSTSRRGGANDEGTDSTVGSNSHTTPGGWK